MKNLLDAAPIGSLVIANYGAMSADYEAIVIDVRDDGSLVVAKQMHEPVAYYEIDHINEWSNKFSSGQGSPIGWCVPPNFQQYADSHMQNECFKMALEAYFARKQANAN